MTVVDLFAGPGGWDLPAHNLGLNPIGFEYDPGTCATRTAAGLRTVRADLHDFELPPTAPLQGIIASPPCPSFSAAGNGSGRDEIPELIGSIDSTDCIPDCYLTDSYLLGVPLTWAHRHRPAWIALEQVPSVLPVWEAMARSLARAGYRTWTGMLCAADYGVPQQRNRAFLLGHRDRPVRPPEPTHAEYPQPSLFGDCPEPWVTMAEALGLVDDRVVLNQYDERTNGNGQPYRRQPTLGEPAPTVTTKVNRWEWKLDQRENEAKPRSLNLPARTLTGSAVNNWVFRRPTTTNAIKVTIGQAAVLQSFPADYPFQGSKSAQAKQIGNAVPPLLASAILRELVAPVA